MPWLAPLDCRPFEVLSAMLSDIVPRNMCAGFTQSLLSHEWQTQRSTGIAPLVSSHAILWAYAGFPFLQMTP